MSATALKLFGDHGPPADSAGDPRLQYTLRQCYSRYVEPELVDDLCAVGTFRQYRCFLKSWERVTGNPGVGELSIEFLREWKRARSEEVAHKTVDKEIRMLTRILNIIGPKTATHKHAAEILLPWPPSVRQYGAKAVRVTKKRPVSPTDWASLHSSARASMLTSCRHIPGPLAMRSAIVAVYSTGLRDADLFSLLYGHAYLDAECPVPGFHYANDHGWLWLSDENPRACGLTCAAKTHKEHCIPLTRSLREHIDAMQSMIGRPADTTPLLPLGGTSEMDRKQRLTFLHAVNQAAAIPEPHLTWQPLRQGANEAWNLACYPAGKYLLQHAMSGVNEEFYTHGLPAMLQAIPRLAEPFTLD